MLPGVYIFTRGGLASTIRVKMPACIVTFTYNVQQRCPEHLALCVSCQYSLSVTFVLFIRCRTMTENRNICGINCRLEFQPMAIVAHYSYRANNVRNLPLLGRIACMHNIDAAYSRCSMVSLCVSLTVTTVSPTDEPIKMPFGVWRGTRVARLRETPGPL